MPQATSSIAGFINDFIEPHKENILSKVYEWIMLIAIALGMIPLMFHTQNQMFLYFDIFSCFWFVVDYILRWVTCGIRSNKSHWTQYLIYPFTPMAIIDLLSILPTFHLLNPTFKVTRVTRLLKMLRIVKIIRYVESLDIILVTVKKQQKFLYAVLSLALFYVFITAMIMFNAEEEINPETGEYLFRNFFDAFYWATCTLTTVGYGDIVPVSDTGRIISIISSLVGIAVIALPSGIITAGYMDELRERKKDATSGTHPDTLNPS